MKLKKGDKIKVMVGKDKGKEGVIEKIFGTKVAIAGVNVYKKHQKPHGEGQKGTIVEVTKPIPIANVAMICPKCKQITRVGCKESAQGRSASGGKVRICRKCEQEI
ncbi:50S ribosomal protein L24 [Candidatus Microgenomates bacterium]|nr:50S ribosomal protein L24 [Candidatus Microgenomates bacterium]